MGSDLLQMIRRQKRSSDRFGFLATNPSAAAQAKTFGKQKELKGLILAQNERWRRGLGMQVERSPQGESGERDSNV